MVFLNFNALFCGMKIAGHFIWSILLICGLNCSTNSAVHPTYMSADMFKMGLAHTIQTATSSVSDSLLKQVFPDSLEGYREINVQSRHFDGLNLFFSTVEARYEGPYLMHISISDYGAVPATYRKQWEIYESYRRSDSLGNNHFYLNDYQAFGWIFEENAPKSYRLSSGLYFRYYLEITLFRQTGREAPEVFEHLWQIFRQLHPDRLKSGKIGIKKS